MLQRQHGAGRASDGRRARRFASPARAHARAMRPLLAAAAAAAPSLGGARGLLAEDGAHGGHGFTFEDVLALCATVAAIVACGKLAKRAGLPALVGASKARGASHRRPRPPLPACCLPQRHR